MRSVKSFARYELLISFKHLTGFMFKNLCSFLQGGHYFDSTCTTGLLTVSIANCKFEILFLLWRLIIFSFFFFLTFSVNEKCIFKAFAFSYFWFLYYFQALTDWFSIIFRRWLWDKFIGFVQCTGMTSIAHKVFRVRWVGCSSCPLNLYREYCSLTFWMWCR